MSQVLRVEIELDKIKRKDLQGYLLKVAETYKAACLNPEYDISGFVQLLTDSDNESIGMAYVDQEEL